MEAHDSGRCSSCPTASYVYNARVDAVHEVYATRKEVDQDLFPWIENFLD